MNPFLSFLWPFHSHRLVGSQERTRNLLRRSRNMRRPTLSGSCQLFFHNGCLSRGLTEMFRCFDAVGRERTLNMAGAGNRFVFVFFAGLPLLGSRKTVYRLIFEGIEGANKVETESDDWLAMKNFNAVVRDDLLLAKLYRAKNITAHGSETRIRQTAKRLLFWGLGIVSYVVAGLILN